MNTLNSKQAFISMIQYMIEDSKNDTDSWEVSDVLSAFDTNERITIHTGGPTADPAAWYDWKRIIQDVLKDKKHYSLNEFDTYQLTCEQAFKAMSDFLEKRYWNKNHNMLLIDAVKDLHNIMNHGNLETSEAWKEWLESVKKALSFKEIFE